MTENRSKTVVIIALCLTLIFMGVGFATLTQTLEIKTDGTVAASKWDINLANWQHDADKKLGGEQVTADVTDVTSSSVTLKFNLSKPGDKVVFSGTINNNGTLNAKLAEAVSTDAFDGQGYVTRTVTGAPSAQGTMLAVGASVPVTITYEFTGTTLPTGEDAVKLTDTIVFNYVQAD